MSLQQEIHQTMLHVLAACPMDIVHAVCTCCINILHKHAKTDMENVKNSYIEMETEICSDGQVTDFCLEVVPSEN
jgi:hypothetical protein